MEIVKPNLKEYRILVTPTSYGRDEPRLRSELEAAVGSVVYNTSGRPLTSDALRELLPGTHGYIAGLDLIDKSALAVADQLKVIARYGAGVDRIDLEAARQHGIVVTNTPNANAVSVAELTIGLMLALARSIPLANAATKQGEWPRISGVSLQNKVVGLLGLGAIGKQVARRLRCFACEIVGHDPFADTAFAQEYDIALLSVEDVIAQADFVSLHVPVLPSTRGMVNADFLRCMKAGAFLVNAARGELIDETALLEALQSGHLRGAALDAFSSEPPGADNPLFMLPNVIATPHTGAHTDGATSAMGWGALNDCLAALRGEPPQHPVQL